MKKQGGFTLIELVVVIVILGILAVTAAPKFLNLQDDARAAAAEGLKGAMKGAAGIVYGKSAIKGVESSDSATISIAGDTVATVYGYPAATDENLKKVVSGLGTDWKLVPDLSGGGTPAVGYSSQNDPSATDCYVLYTQAESATAEPVIELENCGG